MRRLLALFVLMSLTLVACGDEGGSDSPTTTAGQPGTTAAGGSDTTAPTGPPPSGDGGTATVNGTTYTFNMVLKCEFDEDLGFELEMQALGSSPDGSVQLDLLIGSFVGSAMHDVSWAGPEGIFSGGAMELSGTWTDMETGTAVDGPIIYTDGGVATGTVVMAAVTGSDATIEVAFEVPIPTEDFACR
jgi:hypothetical protein